MAINLDIVIDSPEDYVDMKSGLDTMQGASDAIRCIAETVLMDHVPQRNSHKSNVRTILKQSFKGSYGHIFSVDIFDEQLKQKFKQLGQVTFAELISYFFAESLYQDPAILSPKAQKVIERLGDVVDELIGQLRVSALENIHEISIKFDYEVKIRFRKNRDDIKELSRFNRETSKVLQAKESNESLDLTVSVTRLNINTGNGRILLQGESDTVAFGFDSKYKEVKLEAKKLFSRNLDQNNGLEPEKWKLLRVVATPVKLKDGKVVKYIVKSFYNDE